MKNKLLIGLLLFQAILFSSCLTTQQTNLLREPGGSIPAYPKVQGIGEYRIKPGDELNVQISVFDTPTAQLFSLYAGAGSSSMGSGWKIRMFTVSPQGNIYFPYLGEIYVKDKTTLEVQNILTNKLNTEISFQCSAIVALGNRFYSVVGESSTGNFAIEKEQTTIYQALSKSQDIGPYGNRSKVKIIRQTSSGTIVKTFDLRSADVVNSEFYYIQPNDVIYIQPLGRQFLGLSSFGALFAMVSTVISVGLSIYSFAK